MSTSVSVNRVPLPANTNSNTPGTLVLRDASGNFSAGTVAANITGNLTGNVTGNALTATALQNSRTIELTGDVTGSASFNGTTNAAITANIGSGVIVNADISNSAAIAGTKIAPDFGSQNVTTSGVGNFKRPSDHWGALGFYNVGTNPLGQLDSHGSFEVTLTGNGYRDNTAGTNLWASYGANGENGAAQIALNPSGEIRFRTEANKPTGSFVGVTDRMRITGDGNVGIGTSNPSSRLHVAGDLTISSATTATTATAGARTLPANPVDFLVVSINGTSRKIPYYAT
jgi:hypothetical protein